MSDEIEGVDFALAAFREDGEWRLEELAHELLDDASAIAQGLRRFPADGGALGLIGIDEDFFLIFRVTSGSTRLLLSDITAADEWELAASAAELLSLPLPDEDDDPEPAGELGLLADLGMSAAEMGELLDDDELFPDETVSEVARALGFGELFDDAVGLTSA